MKKLIIGVDPDVDGKGFAIYEDGVLTEFKILSLIHLYQFIEMVEYPIYEIEVHIEDLHSNKGCWTGGGSGGARNVGRCEQMQLEVERVFKHFNIKVVRHKVSSRWKKGPAALKEFKQVTGWKGRSNEDTRSAAYFGYLGVIG